MFQMEERANIILRKMENEYNMNLTPEQKRSIIRQALNNYMDVLMKPRKFEIIDLSPSENHICNILTEQLLEKYFDR